MLWYDALPEMMPIGWLLGILIFGWFCHWLDGTYQRKRRARHIRRRGYKKGMWS